MFEVPEGQAIKRELEMIIGPLEQFVGWSSERLFWHSKDGYVFPTGIGALVMAWDVLTFVSPIRQEELLDEMDITI